MPDEFDDTLAQFRARLALRDLRRRNEREPWIGPASQCRWVRERVLRIIAGGLALELAEMERKVKQS